MKGQERRRQAAGKKIICDFLSDFMNLLEIPFFSLSLSD